MDDGKIIDMFFARNEDAIRHTDAAYGRRLYHLADRIVENGQDAEESVSDTYLKAWNTIPPKRPEHFFAYIAKICRNFALKKVGLEERPEAEGGGRGPNPGNGKLHSGYLPGQRVGRPGTGAASGCISRTLTPDNQMVFLRRYWYVDTIAGDCRPVRHQRKRRTDAAEPDEAKAFGISCKGGHSRMNGKDIFGVYSISATISLKTRKPDSSPPRIKKVGRRTVPSAVPANCGADRAAASAGGVRLQSAAGGTMSDSQVSYIQEKRPGFLRKPDLRRLHNHTEIRLFRNESGLCHLWADSPGGYRPGLCPW